MALGCEVLLFGYWINAWRNLLEDYRLLVLNSENAEEQDSCHLVVNHLIDFCKALTISSEIKEAGVSDFIRFSE